MKASTILRENRTQLKYIADLITWTSATLFAYLLRFDGEIQSWAELIRQTTFVLFGFKAITLFLTNQYQRSWSNIGFQDLYRLFVPVTVFSAIYFAISLLFRAEVSIPASIPVLEFMIAFPVMAGYRMFIRYLIVYRGIPLKGEIRSKIAPEDKKRILIIGAGDAGAITAREMLRNPQTGYEPVGFLDDDRTKRKSRIVGIPVLGNIRSMKKVCKEYEIDEIVISMPSQPGNVIRYIVSQAQETGLTYRIVPGFYDLISGKVTIEEIRKVDLEDLLKRKPVQLDNDKIAYYLKGKTVLITGAGGSIGSEIVRQAMVHSPETIVLVGRGENSIHEVLKELTSEDQFTKLIPRICDIRDRASLELIFKEFRPDVVFHAAAHKHVYLMEQNPAQAVFNNIFGTLNVVELCLDYQVRRMVNISTDKAVNPTSVMGATKRISEMIVNHASEKAREGQAFISVRFGNVLGSRGSVVPIFREQIRQGGPLTVTHPDMIRYFMTIPEASQLVLQSGAIARNGLVYVLDMGEPVKILDMARDLIRLSGFEPDRDIQIKFTGVQPGEKMYEELLTRKEGMSISQHESIFIANSESINTFTGLRFDQYMDDLLNIALQTSFSDREKNKLKQKIKELVPGFEIGSVLEV